MKQITEGPKFRQRHHAGYPWEEWWAAMPNPGDVIELEQGKDFGPAPEVFRKQIALRARSEDPPVYIRTTITEDRKIRVLRCASAPVTNRQPRYDWDTWLDGGEHRLLPGNDFEVTMPIMVAQARAAAGNRGLSLRTNTTYQPGALWIKAIPKEEPQSWVTPEDIERVENGSAVASEAETPQEVPDARTAAEEEQRAPSSEHADRGAD